MIALRTFCSTCRNALFTGILSVPLTSFAAEPVDLDVPFVTSPPAVTEAMLNIAATGAGDYVIDLGSGDGRIVILAAKKFGARGLGVDIDPSLVEQSRGYARRSGVADRTEFRVQDLFTTDLSAASVITMYLLPDVNLALRPKLLMLKPGTRVVSHDWDMGDWRPDAELTLQTPEKKLGRDKTSRVMLWKIPARVEGRWCASPAGEMELKQRYQMLEGTLQGKGKTTLSGKMDGGVLQLQLADGKETIRGELRGDKLIFAPSPAWSGSREWQRSDSPCEVRARPARGY